MGLVTFLLRQTQYTKFVVKPNTAYLVGFAKYSKFVVKPNTAYLVGFAKYSDRLRFSLFSFS